MENPRKKENRTHTCSVPFSGLISRKSSSSIVAELIKYILIQREQVPESFPSLLAVNLEENLQQKSKETAYLPFLKANNTNGGCFVQNNVEGRSYSSEFDSLIAENGADHSNTGIIRDDLLQTVGPSLGPARVKSKTPSVRKRDQAIETATQIFFQLDVAFSQSVLPIQKVAFIIGSSLFTPKDTFVLNFPTNHTEGDDLPWSVVKQTFFRQLVCSDFIGSFSQSGTVSYGLQKLYVLLLAGRDSNIRWFTPAPRFTISSRGNIYHIYLTNPPANNSMCVGDSTVLELSGVSPMELSADFTNPPSAKKRCVDLSFEDMSDSEELIWYQAPVTFKGFK